MTYNVFDGTLNLTQPQPNISTLQFICKLCSFTHIVSMQSNGAAITYLFPVPDGYASGYPANIRFRPDFIPNL